MEILGWLIIICIAVLLVVLVISAYENRHFSVKRYVIESPKIPGVFDGMKIAVLSDLHNQEFGRGNERLIAAIEEQKPDMIIGAGDLLVGRRGTDFSTASNLVEHLTKKYPVYMALGNHEYRLRIYQEDYDDMWQRYYDLTREAGAVWLDNETVYIHRDAQGHIWTGEHDNQESIALSGFTMDAIYYRRFKHTPMDSDYVRRQCPYDRRDIFQILLAHNPDYFPEYAGYGADLVISGHVHGGMVRLPFLGGVISPMFTFFPKYDRGAFFEGNSQMLLSGGLGNHTFKIRVNNKPELMMVVFQSRLS